MESWELATQLLVDDSVFMCIYESFMNSKEKIEETLDVFERFEKSSNKSKYAIKKKYIKHIRNSMQFYLRNINSGIEYGLGYKKSKLNKINECIEELNTFLYSKSKQGHKISNRNTRQLNAKKHKSCGKSRDK